MALDDVLVVARVRDEEDQPLCAEVALLGRAPSLDQLDVVGLSILSGAHMTLVPKVTAKLKDAGMDDVLVVVGGIIPDDDIPALKEAGVAEVFGPGTTIAQVAEFLRANARPRD